MRFSMNFNGIGDNLMGLLVTSAAKKAYPHETITYSCKQIPWVSLFDGYDKLIPYTAHGIELNQGYNHEVATKSIEPRYSRYLRNGGITTASVPNLKEREALTERGKSYKGVVALAVKSCYENRNYSLKAWLTLEQMLIEKGYKCVIIHNRPKDIAEFKSEKTINKTPAEIVSILLNAHCLISIDSGMAHVSSMIGTRTIVLTGPTRASSVFYCPVTEVTSSLHCTHCYWQRPNFVPDCNKACSALYNIDPRKIIEHVLL